MLTRKKAIEIIKKSDLLYKTTFFIWGIFCFIRAKFIFSEVNHNLLQKNKAKILVCVHPDNLLFYKNLVKIIKKHNQEIKVVLFKVNHPYFLRFDFDPYKQYFDEIIEFDFIHYKKNLLKEWWKIFNFQKKIRKTINDLLVDYEITDAFLLDSTWLSNNVMLYQLNRNKKIKKVIRFILWEKEHQQIRINKLKTLFCYLYTLLFDCYKVKVMETFCGEFTGFILADNVAGNSVKVVSPMKKYFKSMEAKKDNILPYPIIKKSFQNQKTLKDTVIIFGNEGAIRQYSEYLQDIQLLNKKLKNIFRNIENYYVNCKLYYKPHPTDQGKIMPGVDISKYNLFDDSTNAEAIFEEYSEKIKAIYSLYSNSVIMGSFFGIPSYAFYRYLFNESGIRRFDNIFNQENLKSDYLFLLSNLEDIGKIDNLKNSNLNFESIEKAYLKIFKT